MSCEIREWPCSRRSCRERGCQEVSQEGVSASRKHSCPPGQEGPDAGRGGAGFRGGLRGFRDVVQASNPEEREGKQAEVTWPQRVLRATVWKVEYPSLSFQT